MAKEHDFIIHANGMRVHKDLSFKQTPSSQPKDINGKDLKLLREKGLVRTIAKSKEVSKEPTQPQELANNITQSRISKRKPTQTLMENEPLPVDKIPVNYLRIDLPKEFLMKKVKKTYFHRFNVGMYVFYGFRDCVCRILQVGDTFLVFDIPADKTTQLKKLHLGKSKRENRKYLKEQIFRISSYDFGVVEKYWDKRKVKSLLLQKEIEHSVKLLKINNIPLRQYKKLESRLVPNKLTSIEFEQWASRMDALIIQSEEKKRQISLAKEKRTKSKNAIAKLSPVPKMAKAMDVRHPIDANPVVLRKRDLKTSDFIVCVNRWRCLRNPVHDIEDIQALIPIVSNGEVMNLVLPAGYCVRCNQYFILSEHFKMNRHRLENALCTIMDIPTYHKYRQGEGFPQWSDESILMKFGYTVAANRDPGPTRRKEVLKRVIEGEVMTKQDVMSHINAQIDLRKNNPSMTWAIAKWRDDLAAISKMSFGRLERSVIVGTIKNPTGQ